MPTHPDTEPTPLPWKISEITRGYLSQPAIVSEGVMICKMPALSNMGGEVNSRAAEIAANAQFIVRAVNSHAALVAALEAVEKIAHERGNAAPMALIQTIIRLGDIAKAALAATRQ